MVFRKRRRPTPGFKIPPPFNPVSGDFADLSPEGVMPYCALMQVAADDTYADYVICRGFDTRLAKFVDYEEGNPELPGISVAKPYGNRKPQTYEIGEIYPAFLPLQGTSTYVPASPFAVNFRLGQNPGVVTDNAEPDGHPSDLDSYIDLLIDHNGKIVNWLLIDTGAQSEEEEEPCDVLQPGSYAAVTGAYIAPGETGPVIVTRFIGSEVLDVVNGSNCAFALGDRVTLHVSPFCEMHITGCACCDAEPPVGDGVMVHICIGGNYQILPIDGGSYTWDISQCCNCEGASLEIVLSVSGDPVDTATAAWEYNCGGASDSGTIDISNLLVGGNIELSAYQLGHLCFGMLFDRFATFAANCKPCCCCCTTYSTTMKGNSAPSQPSTLYTVEITMDKQEFCPGDFLTVDMTITATPGSYPGTGNPKIVFGNHFEFGFKVYSFEATPPFGNLQFISASPSNTLHVSFFPFDGCGHRGGSVIWPSVTLNPGESIQRSVTVYVASVGGRCDSVPTVAQSTGPFSSPILPRPAVFGSFGRTTYPGGENYAYLESISGRPCLGSDGGDPGPGPEPEDCCDKSRWVCINGDSRQMAFDGGDETWDVSDCCPACTSATLRMRFTCVNETVSLQQTYTCDGESFTETTNLSGLCNTTAPVSIPISTAQCFLLAVISATNQPCESCDSCCDETRWFCINGISKQMTLAGDTETFDVKDCCDCETSVLTLSVECIGETNTLRIDWSITCGESIEPASGFDFIACDASVFNIVVNECFYQVQISETNIGCAECEGGGGTTITTPPFEEPPPPGP